MLPRILSLALALLVAACGSDPDPVSPEPVAEVSGRVTLFQINGVPGDNGGAIVAIEGLPDAVDTTDAVGVFRIEGIRPGRRTVSVSKPGFGTWREIDKQIDGDHGYQYGGINLGEIPRATVSSLSVQISGTSITFSGLVSELGVAERGQQVLVYLGVSDTVSNNAHSHSTRSFIDVDPGTRNFSYTIGAEYFLTIGLAQGMRLHAAAYVVDPETTTHYPVPGLALDELTSVSEPARRTSFLIP
jgi:hypothetical protein